MTALKIIEVTPDMADAFMGASEVDEAGAVLLPRSREHDTGTRTVLFTDIVGSTSLTHRLGCRRSDDHDRRTRLHCPCSVDQRERSETSASWSATFNRWVHKCTSRRAYDLGIPEKHSSRSQADFRPVE
jgi:hypothetical protein